MSVVERFGPRGAQEHRAEHRESGHAVGEQIGKAIARVECDQYARVARHAAEPEHADDDEPDRHDRPKQFPDSSAALRLQREDRDQHRHRERHDIGCNRRHRQFQSLKRAQHRDRRRYRPVAIEQRGAEHPDRDHDRAIAVLDAEQRHQRQDTAFSVIVG
jgi:hypothetical protein